MKVWILRRQLMAWPDDPVKVTKEVTKVATSWDTDRDKAYWIEIGMLYRERGLDHWIGRREE